MAIRLVAGLHQLLAALRTVCSGYPAEYLCRRTDNILDAGGPHCAGSTAVNMYAGTG